MKIKVKHNKRRNPAILYETLIRELTKSVVNKDHARRTKITSMVKEFFNKTTDLGKELEHYRSLSETTGLEPYTAEKLICELRHTHSHLDEKKLTAQKAALIKKINKDLGKEVFSNFIPNYKNLATIYQIFDRDLPTKSRVILEEKVLRRMVSSGKKAASETLSTIDDITFKLFSRKFNTSYAKSLFEEQKELLKNYIHSFTDNGVELKIYLNEEVGRLKQKVKDSLETEEVKNDKDMLQKTKKIITILEDFKTEQIDKEMISKVLKVQDLVREIESDG